MSGEGALENSPWVENVKSFLNCYVAPMGDLDHPGEVGDCQEGRVVLVVQR